MKDLEPPAHEKSTDRVPPDGPGPARGQSPEPEQPAPSATRSGPEPEPLPSPDPAARAPQASPEAIAGPPVASPEALARLHATGEPGTLPPTWCRRCAVMVKPEGKGRCPRCQTFLRQNFVGRRHPVNILRRQQILDRLVAEYRPQTTMLKDTCEDLAAVRERLETEKPGTQDHKRLVEMSQALYTTLEASRTTHADTGTTLAGLSDQQLLDRAALIHARMRELVEKRTEPPLPSPFDTPAVIEPRAPATAAPDAPGGEGDITQSGNSDPPSPAPDPPPPDPPPPDPDRITTRTLPYGSKEREDATRELWKMFRIQPPRY